MAESIIVRDGTKEELNGPVSGDNTTAFVPIIDSKGVVKSPKDKFHAKVEEKAQEYRKLKKPFCRRCCYQDMKQLIKQMEGESGYVADFKKLGIKMPDLDDYGKADRFKFVCSGETKNAGKEKTKGITIDSWKKYRCVVRGCEFTIFE